MSTPSDRPRDTALEDADIGHDHTQTPTGDEPQPTGPRHDLPNGTRVGEFEIDGLLGEGGMGRVYSAIHPVIGKRAAVKVLHPRFASNDEVVERFIQEARAANQIGHPNIVDIFAFGTLDEGLHYFVMEWLKGEALYDRMRRHPLSREEICDFVTDISHALEAAHEKRIIHRDLKPENVFLHRVKGDHIQIKLLDFGIAKLVTEESRIDRTRTGTMMGTPKYIAPEQARGYAVDYRVDIYSLGVMLFELVAQRLPFDADNAMDLVAMHLHEDPPSLLEVMPGTPPQLAQIVSEMLSKEAAGRPSLAKVRAVLSEVRALPASSGADTEMRAAVAGASPTMFGAPSRKKSRALAIGLGVGVLAVGAIAAVVVMGGTSSSEPPAKQLVPEVKSEKKDPVTVEPPIEKKVAPVIVKDPTERVEIALSRSVPGELAVDSTHYGNGPAWSLQLSAGRHYIEFTPRDGSKPVLVGFDVALGKTAKVEIPIAKPETLDSTPPKQQPPKQQPPKQQPPKQQPPKQQPPAGDGDDLLPLSKGPR